MSLLEIKKINKFFGGLQAVNNVSFQLNSGLIKAVIGPNGAGKTTLFNLISGSILPTSGRVFFQKTDITNYKPYLVARKGIARTFQNIKLCRHMTVLENVMIGRHTRSKAGFLSAFLNLPMTWKEEKLIQEEAMKVIELLGIEDYREKEVSQLPFGIQRSVELARALAAEPTLLLLDEPASGLNIHETKDLAKLICDIKNKGITILIVEHDMSLIMDISDEIVVLNFGQKIAEGKPREIQANQEVINIYLGETDA
jgi:branched-chain amino acid transport system ATP-binding protein